MTDLIAPLTSSTLRRPHGHVLLVEDDIDEAMLITRWLELSGAYTIKHVTSGAAAVEAVCWANTWDLVIADINLPDMQGFEVLRRSKAARPWLPVLLITAELGPGYPLEAIRHRTDDMLLKPLQEHDLIDRVATLVALGQRQRRAQELVVLAVGAHPDDVEIGIGGILLKHAAKGDTIIHVCLTDGEEGGAKHDRTVEAQRAADRLGAILIRGALRDTQLAEAGDTTDVIARAIQTYKPHVMYVHTLHDGHQDHRAAHRAAMVAARTIPKIYCYQSPSSTIDFRPQQYVDIGGFLDEKIAIINLYESQASVRNYLTEQVLRSTAVYWGRYANYRLVEPLETIRETLA
jgi:LmbE family N-acetylglucosaminyl deacetylase/CheY-like chemotaxis protein